MTTFTDLGVSAPVVRALERRGITQPFQIQALVIRDAVAGRDVLAKSRTGSGKTLGFGIPLVERLEPGPRRPSALVLVPTRELALQVAEEVEAIAGSRGLRVTAVYGGAGIQAQARAASRADVLVATPGRLQDLLDRRSVSLRSIGILVLDEADRMLDMGFQPQVDRIVRQLPKDRQTMFFSATLDGAVGRIAQAYTRDPVRHEVEGEGHTVEEADHRFVPVQREDKLTALIELAAAEEPGLTLVFVNTKRAVDSLARQLRAGGMPAVAMHGDLSQEAREKALRRFEQRHVGVLVATDVAARGLDLEGISLVVNYDPPLDDKGYVHRVGRTARAGRTGTSVT
ncbi:MAG TPA: DEAD/DEAH box helicase, partial [Actinomycetota bacterium]|nr:DEAD/DEAH box helicase [Actinomycetota bacterium]